MFKSTKALVISAFSAIYMLLAFLFWTASSPSGDEKAFELFKDKQYRYAHIYVEELEKTLLDPRYALYQAYILRGDQDLINSDIRLQQALKLIEKKGGSQHLLMEIYLNQALNAYLGDKPDEIRAAIKNAEKVNEVDQSWLPLFSSIYDTKQNKPNREEFGWLEKKSLKYLSPWMREAFSIRFNDDWFELHQIRWLIDSGQFITARQKLDEIGTSVSSHLQEEIIFLNGLNYFKEGQKRSSNHAAAYYKLAFSYFNCLKQKQHHKDWQVIAVGLQKQIREAIATSDQWENVCFYFGLLERLAPWIDAHVIVPDLAYVIEQRNPEQANEFVQLIAKSSFREEMKNHLEAAAKALLRQKNYDQAEYYGKLIDRLNESGETNGLIVAIKQEILRVIHMDTEQMDQTAMLLSLWSQLETIAERRLSFVSQVVHESERIWCAYGNHEKAIILMKLVEEVSLPSERTEVHQLLEASVETIYRSAVICDQVSQYFCVMDAVRALNLIQVDIFNREETLHQLGDAEYYFGKRRLQEANERALWVLQIDPQNQIANRIAGLIAHAEGNMEKAFFYLNKLQKQDSLTKKAIETAVKE